MQLTLNGRLVVASTRPEASLLELLREEFGLRSMKDGCAPEGSCGACTVIVDGRGVVSCAQPAARFAGRSVETLEGLPAETRELWADAMTATGASQCGFCSPGIVMKAEALLRRDPEPARDEIARALAGNLCRCTGYVKVIDAIELAAAARRGGPAPLVERSGAIGSRTARYEGRALALGERPFVNDLHVSGMLHGAIRFSDHPRARIRRIDTTRAAALPGVVAVVTWRDVPGKRRQGLIVDPRGARAYTGVTMRMRLVRGLGIRRSGRVVGLIVNRAIEDAKVADPADPTRRGLLKAAGFAIAGAVIGLPITASKASAAGAGEITTGSISPSASYGIKEYFVSQAGDHLEVQFKHEKPSLSGVLAISGIVEATTIVSLSRKSRVLGLELDREASRFTLDAGTDGKAIWTFSDGAATPSAGAEDLYAAHKADFEIAAIITSELTPKPSPTITAKEVATAEPALATALYCPCSTGNNYVRGSSGLTPHWWRSDACYAATSDVNFKCTNSYCWGCCLMFECDCVCTLGDFLCLCTRRGHYCTGPCT